MLRTFYRIFQEAVELPVVFQRVYDVLPGMLKVSRASILLYDAELKALVSGDYIGAVHRGEELTSAPQAVGHSISGVCFAESRAVVVNDCSSTDLIPAEFVQRLHLKSTTAVPILWKNAVIGVLRVDDCEKTDRFSDEDLEVLQLIAEPLAVVVQNAQLLSDLHRRERELLRMNAELEAARDAARSAGEAKGSFLARVSHELRTPLNSMMGYIELLRDEAQQSRRTKLDMDLVKMRSAADHLMDTIENLLDLSRIEAGKAYLRKEVINVRRAVEAAAGEIQPAIARRNNRLEVYCPAGVSFITGDNVKFHQMLMSLLSNATEFTRRGTVSLSVEDVPADDDGRWVLVHVSDTGQGFSPDELKSLMDSVYQVEVDERNSTTTRGIGTGLGLAVSRHLARLMGGDLLAKSTPGLGSTFTLKMPAAV